MKKFTKNAVGFILLFITVALAVSLSILIYNKIRDESKWKVAILLLVLILFLATAYFVIDLFRRKVFVNAPVNKILEGTEQIMKGNFKYRFILTHKPSRYDEFDYIMLRLNKVVEELGKTEVLHNDFIANFSHEVKTPLAVLKNYAVALSTLDLDDKSKKEYLDAIVESVNKLSNLVSSILKLNKLENQKILLKSVKFDASEKVRECVLSFLDEIEKKNINLSLDLDEVTAKTDGDMLELVISNLLSNAIKFTKSEIKISLSKTNGYIALKVKDDGIVIKKEVGDRLFEKFYQVETSHSSEGNGLGLALVKKVVDLLGGEIQVESEENKGSEFTVKIKDEL